MYCSGGESWRIISTTSGSASPALLRPSLRPCCAPRLPPRGLRPPPLVRSLSTGLSHFKPGHRHRCKRGSFSRSPTTGPRARPAKRRTWILWGRSGGDNVASAVANCRPSHHDHTLLRCHAGKSILLTHPKFPLF